MRTKHKVATFLTLLILLGGLLGISPAQASETLPVNPGSNTTVNDYTLSSTFLKFWNANGGLAVFGLPIDQERRKQGVSFQWLERNRFELHTENKPPYNVLLGLLGVEALKYKGIDWHTLPTVGAAPQGCRYFAETGHSLCADFLGYWQTHGLEFDGYFGKSYGESLALFGFPISEPKMETNSSGDTVLTQWFERARFELHPENPDPYRVLLGRLGAEVFAVAP